MDDMRASLSRVKKGIKHRFTDSKRKTDKARADGRAEGADSSGSLPQPEPRIVTAGGRKRKRNEANVDDETVGPSATADGNRPGWKSTASASAKLLLRGVRDSADAFGPLKSVAGGLCFILESCEVRSPPAYAIHIAHECPANEGKQTGDRIFSTQGQSTRGTAL